MRADPIFGVRLRPYGIHVTHIILDGVMRGKRATDTYKLPDTSCMGSDDVAEAYMSLIDQKPSAWTNELDLRPWTECF